MTDVWAGTDFNGIDHLKLAYRNDGNGVGAVVGDVEKLLRCVQAAGVGEVSHGNDLHQ